MEGALCQESRSLRSYSLGSTELTLPAAYGMEIGLLDLRSPGAGTWDGWIIALPLDFLCRTPRTMESLQYPFF